MLSQITIEKLFNIYDYTIPLVDNEGESNVKFITAPNGFGKTTILDFVYAVFTLQYERLFKIPFKSFSLVFSESDDTEYTVSVSKSEQRPSHDGKSDISDDIKCKLNISLYEKGKGEVKELGSCTCFMEADGRMGVSGDSNNIDMFFTSRTCHYVTDKRLLNIKTDQDTSSKEMNDIDMGTYANQMKLILNNPIKKKDYARSIDIFQKVIKQNEFVNKRMELSEQFGIRFVANDELESKLSLDNLSSGEKHMIIQTFELLFNAQGETLVLIDEPELSFHMMWQMNYLKNLEEIIRERGFQCIVATHSPQIFNSIWSKSVDLYDITTHSQ